MTGDYMDFSVFLSSFGIIFLAELGDKTQLTALSLAMKYQWQKVFLGLAAAFALLNLAAVLVGDLLFATLPAFWIKLASALLFLYFGIFTLLGRGGEEAADEPGERKGSQRSPIAAAFFMILLAELGDKTQIVTASLAAQHDSAWEVFFGSTIALWCVSLIGITLGTQLTKLFPLLYIHRAAGCLFLIFGLFVAYQAYMAF